MIMYKKKTKQKKRQANIQTCMFVDLGNSCSFLNLTKLIGQT